MKIVIISDTHGLHLRMSPVPDGDLLIHCGDCTLDGSYHDLRQFLMWFNALPHKNKVLVAGNHDWVFEKSPLLAEVALKECAPSIHYLQDSGTNIEGFNVWGSPVQPEFMDWAFNRKRGKEIAEHWKLIPKDTDILVTHAPPRGILDTVKSNTEHLGDEELLESATYVHPKLHCFGHIHGGYGEAYNGSICVNAAICDEAYNPKRKPVVVNL